MSDLSDRLSSLSPERRELLEALLRKKRAAAAAAATIPPRDGSGPWPLSFSQERLWLVHQLEPESPAYNMPSALRFEGELSVPALAESLAAIVRRHESLRTRFGLQNGQPVQEIDTAVEIPLPVVDLAELPPERREAEAVRLTGEEALRPFDLARAPLLRPTLLTLSGRDHVLLATLHHIASDGWSMGVFARELGAFYRASLSGQAAALPPLPIQYADFALWQRRTLSGPALDERLAFWREALSGLDPVLELPADRPRPARRSPRGAALPFTLPAALSRDVLELSRREGTTLFTTLLAAFLALLHRLTGKDRLPIGTPVAGRSHLETEGLIGFFVDTLVVPSDLSAGPSFHEHVRRVGEFVLEAQSRSVPFERLVSELAPERSLAYSPVFQVLFALQNAPGGALEMPGLKVRGADLPLRTTKFDLSLFLWEEGERLAGVLEHSLDLFDGPTVERLAAHLEVLLAEMVRNPDAPIQELPLLSPLARHQVLAEWNDAAAGFPEACLHELVAEQAQRTPEAVAVSFEGESLTYRELDRRANRLAHRLRRHGVGPETLVGLLTLRSLEMVVGLLGILKAGGAYVPLDPGHPEARWALLLDEAGVGILLVQEPFAGRLDRQKVVLPPGGDLPEESEEAPPSLSGPENLAYVLFTSGSTGTPKGVAVPHRAVVRLVKGRGDLEIGSDEVWLLMAPLAFDASTLEIWGPLVNGGRLEVLGPDRPSLEEIGQAVEARQVTSLWLTAGLFHQMAEGDLSPLRGLRKLLAGGDVLSPAHVRRALEQLPGCRVINGYGPTENTTFTCCHPMTAPDELPGAVPVGRPIAGTRVVLLDGNGQPVPAGVAGELCAGGAGLARGYLGRPDLTAERFVPDPFPESPGERLYRTGDLARSLPDGRIDFLGRIDQQVKIRGFRIEPGEIEAALASHPGVRECVVLARRDRPGDVRLVAYVAAPGGRAPRPDDLRRHLAERLPEAMVPSAFVFLETLPLTPNGKVDRKALPAPESPRETGEGYAAPSDPVQEILAGIWAEVLGLSRVGVHDDFFALGGHSLLATQVASRLRSAFGVELPLRRLFEAPTIAELARAVRESREGRQAPPIVPVPREGDLPLSFAQQRLWFLDQLEPGSPAYNIPSAVRLTGEISAGELSRIFAEVVRRHEALRTTFAARDGRPVQVVAPELDIPLPVVDLAGLPEAEREGRAREIAAEEARRPFDLARGPLLRLGLVRLGARDHLLLITLHHIVSDGWSMGVLLREIAALHEAFSTGRPAALPTLPVQYADFAAWQRQWLQGEILEAQLAYWRRQLAGAPRALELPLDRPRPAVQTFRGASWDLILPPPLSEAVHGIGRREGATPFMVFLASWAIVLGRHAGQEDVLLGTPIAGRNRQEIEGLIGFFVNTLVLRTDLSGSPGFAGLLGQVRQTALDAYTHQDVPFERLVEELVPERDLAHSPLFQVLLTLQNAAGRGVSVPGLSLAPLAFESEVAKFDLSLTFAEREDRVFAGSVEYNVDLFDAGTVERLGARYQALLEAAAANPDLPVFDLPLLTDAERRQLAEWNDTGSAPPSGAGLHELFAAQVERTPDAVALVHGTSRWTYAELAAQAGGLAYRLRALGVGPESRVAVCLERSPDLIASLFGVLAAGGAYVPIDPAYPVERRTLMLEDSGAAVLVTRGPLSADLPETAAHRLDLDAEEIPGAELPRGGSVPGHLAYVIYTSGSTGRPKGVGIEHRSAVALALWAREEFSAEELSGLMAATSVCFDLSVFEIFVPLSWGGTIVLADNALALSSLPRRDEVRLLNTVPSAATELVRSGGLPPSVQTVCLAGEPLPASLVEALYAMGTVERVLNLYGPSEDTTYSTGVVVPRKTERVPSIGRPLPGTRAWVVDRRGTPVPVGVAGELWLSGAGLARGYLGRPELTAERFSPDPFGGPGDRVYRTGDLVRFRPDGELEFLGRIDHQVKIRGFRIELGEIEAALGSHPSVRECVVLAREDVPGLRLLVAYVTGDALPEAGVLRSWLTARLPEYMVPTVFVPLEALPLTPNGKLDRRALPAPERSGSAEGDYGAPADPVEELLAGIWTEVLRLDRVGAHDDFFALGGHSLLATQVVSRVRDVLGVELPVRRLFEAPTIAALARTVRESREGRQAPPIVRTPRTGDLPLSFAQQRLWLIDQLDPGNPAYNVPFAVRLRGEVRADLLARVFAEVVRRHEALRTTFASRDGKPVQVIAPELEPELPILDLSHLPEAEREARAQELALEEARRPFDLARGPLLRLTLARLGEQDHLLLVTMHHIVSDGWSLGVLLSEIGALFAAFSEGRPSPLPELPVQYADFAAWQRTWLEGEVLDEQLSYWKQQLAGAPQNLDLPTDRPRPAMQTFHGAVRSLTLSAALSDGVRELCRRQGATPFMALLAAWAALLGRHAGQDDVLVGTPIAGRNRRETEGLIGFFINTLVMRAGMADQPGFADLLGRIRAVALDAYAHQDLPFERLVEELVPERDLSRSPLFQVLFALQNAPFGALSVSGLSLEPVAAHGGTTKFDLTLTLGESPSGFTGALEYNTDLFDGDTVERLLARFTTFLEGAVASPGTALPDLPLLTPEERQQLLAWGGTAGEPSAETLHGRFEARVRQAPGAVAVVFEGESLTYGELNRRANRLAWHLRELGVGPDERVGLCAERSLELLAGLLGILKAGGAYVPLDPRYPAERLAFTLEDAGCRVLVGTEEAVAGLPDGARRVLLDREDLAGLPEHDPPPLGDGSSLAYVIYTSGSTGRPKGSLLAHGHVVRLFDATDGWFGFGERDVWTLFHSYAFDFSVWEIWGALLYGGRLVVVPYLVSRSPEDFHDLLAREGVTVLNQTPSAFAQLARVDGERGGVPTDLRLIIFGGEALDPGSVAAWFARHGDEKPLLVNMYGITETTVHVTYRPLRRKDVEERRSVIGVPIPDLAVSVLDPWLHPAPIGVPGELVVAGAGLARGYLGRPDLTAERFVPDTVSGRPGARVYRSGDLARYLPDGDLEYLGRIDHQVKIRGFRIELGEIEAVLASHPGVRECVVMVRDDAPGGRGLVAYVTGDGVPEPGELRAFGAGRLPDYMVPAAFVSLDSLPLTANGKLDRRALPAPERTGSEGGGHAAPADPVEELLAGIWAEVLGLPAVSVHDDFFALGGHSLLATQVVSRVRSVLGVELPLRRLFEAPTVAELARVVRESGEGRQAPPMLPTPRDGGLPLSFAQQRLWLIDQLDPGNPAYNIPFAVRLEGEVRADLLTRVFAEVVRRHGSLRTTFASYEGKPVQVVAPELAPELPLLDLSDLPATERETRAQELAVQEAQRPFDLARGPLLRLILVRLGARDHLLLMTMHHIVSDDWSVGVLLSEIGALFAAFSEGRPSPLPELPMQYADFAAWQRTWLEGEVLDEQLAYWKRQLAGAPQRLELPTDRPRPALRTFHGAVHPVTLSSALSEAMRDLCRRQGVTPFMAFLAAWAVLLGRHAGQDDVLVGTPIAGRNRRETEGLIGFFINTLVMRADMAGQPGFLEILGRVRAMALDAYAHQDLPFERLVEELVPERDLSRSPLFQVLFALQNAPFGALSVPGLSLKPVAAHGGTTKFDLTLTLGESPAGFAGALEYNTGLFDATTIGRLLSHFGNLLAGSVENPDRPAGELPLLDRAERHHILVEWNDAATAYPREACLPELFGAVARDLPDAPAVIADGEVWTYRRLDEASNRLARRLRALGAGPEVAVGLSMERSPELILGLLAILKAGGVYVPLDPAYPDERLAFMLADTGAGVVLVHERTRERLEGRARLLPVESKDWQQEDGSPLGVRVPAGSLALVIYTSGSTGRPKGVALPHRGVVRLVRKTRHLRVGPGDRVAHAANISFDAATLEIWGALLNGAALVVIPKEAALSPAELAARLRRGEVTTLFLTTALFNQVAGEEPGALAPLRTVMFGGEAADPAAVARALREGPKRLLHLYGPAESTTLASWHPVREVAEGAVTVPIGLPVSNSSLYVLDRLQNPVPPGVVGELFVGGDGLARGYLNRPELTAERFIPHPWGHGDRLYRTGDLGRQRPDGAVEFVGRGDGQVKIRGFRIEPGEIEAVLGSHPGVRECVVLARRDAPGEVRLVAYVAGHGGQAPEVEDLRRHLKERLPAHMVPSAFVTLESLPLSPNGKVDRKTLPAPEITRATDGGYVAPADPVEEGLAGIFAQVLGLDRVGARDDFFALGGHSLLATQVMSRIRGTLGAELPLRRLFEAPTVAGLAQAVRESRDVRQAPPIVPVTRDGELPLSFAQQRLWFLDRLEPGSPAYNIPLAVRLDGELPVDLLARIFTEIVRRHETLRTTFAVHEGRPVQVIAPAAEPEIRRADLSQLPKAEREAEARRLARAEALRPFDLESGPLLRLSLVRMTSREHLLLLTQHHIVSDGWSMGILLREIAALYEAFSQGRPSPLPELPVQYADFAAWQRSWLTGEALEAQIAYWRERLRGAPPVLELPTDRPRGAPGGKAGAASRQSVIGPVLTRELKALGQSRGATPFLLLLAAFDVLLYRWTGQTDLVVGSPIAGRNRLETEGLIGFFVNTLAIRSTFAGEAPFADLLARVRISVIEDHAHQDLPFEKLVEELQPERSLHHTPLFQVMLNLLNTPRAAVELPGLTLAPFPSEAISSKFELSLAVNDLGEDLVISAGYRAELFDPATIDRLLAHFEQILSGLVATPERRIDELPLLSTAERHHLLEWSATRSTPLPDLLVHEIFEAQAARSPEAIALVCEGERLTCRELDRRANRLAHRLRRAGVGPETRVALLVERSLEMIIGLLGVLKAGGAYVPLDPTYPPARLAFMLEEAGARVLLAQEHLAGLLPAENREVIVLAPGEDLLAGESEERLPRLGSPESLAYVLFTSGSTGRPKGVAVEHRQLVHYTTAVLERLALDGPASFATVSTLSADLGNTSVFPALFTGGALHVIKAERAADPQAMAEYLDREPVDCLKIVPSHLRALRAFSRPAGVLPRKRLVFGGEALPWTDVDEVRALAPGLTVLNHYGPTESTVGVLTHRVADGAPRLGATVPLGRPLANVRTWVVDASGQLSPTGVPGELLLGGAGLARGYLGRPDLTAARFVPDPFGPEAGARLYRTGDLVRHQPDGALEFLGRIDQQVKIRGFRVEPGEIEAVMKALPEVAEAVVLAREHAPGDRRLVAWLVPSPGASPTPESLRRALQGVLPDALIPTAFVLLPALPLTPNGKVDRQDLARQAPDGSAAPERVYTPPASPVEETLAEIWSSLLRVERVGRDDSFFDLGGHSLLATQLISRVRESFGIDIPLRSLFEAPTIARFGEAVLARQVESQDAAELERLLAELEELSDEEAETLADE